MGLENFEEFYNIVKDELKGNRIEVDEEKLRRMTLMIDHHGRNVQKEEYKLLAESFVAGIFYNDSLERGLF